MNTQQAQGPPPQQGNPMQLATIEHLREGGFRTVEYRDEQGQLQRRQEPNGFKRGVRIASPGTRFGNSFLDGLMLTIPFIFISFLFITPIDHYSYGSNYSFQYTFNGEFYLIWLAYYFLMEWRFSRTLSKFITKCTVINKYGLPANVSEVAIRTICRIIPFEAFSFLGDGRGWHDRFAETWVVPYDEAHELQRLMRDQFPDHPEYVKYDQEQAMKKG